MSLEKAIGRLKAHETMRIYHGNDEEHLLLTHVEWHERNKKGDGGESSSRMKKRVGAATGATVASRAAATAGAAKVAAAAEIRHARRAMADATPGRPVTSPKLIVSTVRSTV